MNEQSEEEKPKIRKVIEGAEGLSLGISIVVAILIGVGLGLLMRNVFGYGWLLWLGVFWGIAGAGLNVYKAYKKQMKSMEELKDSRRYKGYKDEEDDEW